MDDCTNRHTYHTGTYAIKNKSAGERTQLVRVLAVKPHYLNKTPHPTCCGVKADFYFG